MAGKSNLKGSIATFCSILCKTLLMIFKTNGFPVLLLFFFLHAVPSMGQSERNISVYATGQYTQTLSDITKNNNPWALGTGLQGFFNSRHAFQFIAEATADAYLYDDKVGYAWFDEATGEYKNIGDVGDIVINVLAGIAVQPAKPFYLSFTAGPSFINGSARFGIKPSAGVYFGHGRKVMAKLSFINVFNRDKKTGSDFTSLSLAAAIRLF